MRIKTTKALLFCSFTAVLLLGVVGIASAAPPVASGPCEPCNCECGDMLVAKKAKTPPFCYGHPKAFPHRSGWGRLAAECLVSCVRNAPKGNQ